MDNKICSKCHTELPTKDFFVKRNGKVGSHCKDCQRQYGRDHYTKNKKYYYNRNLLRKKQRQEWLKKFLEHKNCSVCNESRIECLDFHHLDADNKVNSVSSLLLNSGLSLDTVQNEIDKCVILCANCHRVQTAKQFGWYKSQG